MYLLLRREADALPDLDAAISHAHRDRLTLRQAHTQRGLIRRGRGDDEGARADFELAARLGSALARQCLVSMNPYAAMCNAMLSRAMKELSEVKEEEKAEFRQVAASPKTKS